MNTDGHEWVRRQDNQAGWHGGRPGHPGFVHDDVVIFANVGPNDGRTPFAPMPTGVSAGSR
jgi:hypothetical protein